MRSGDSKLEGSRARIALDLRMQQDKQSPPLRGLCIDDLHKPRLSMAALDSGFRASAPKTDGAVFLVSSAASGREFLQTGNHGHDLLASQIIKPAQSISLPTWGDREEGRGGGRRDAMF